MLGAALVSQPFVLFSLKQIPKFGIPDELLK
jgi:hypothetical protein